MNTKISVIIAVPDGNALLSRCIDSVTAQSFNSFEIILVCSDKARALAESCMGAHARITLLEIETFGFSSARNLGIERATGKYILFLGCNDTLERVALERAYTGITSGDFRIATFDYKRFSPDGYSYSGSDTVFRYDSLEGEKCREALAVNRGFFGCKLYEKAFLDDNNIRFSIDTEYGNLSLWVRSCMCADKIALIHSPLYNLSQSAELDGDAQSFLRDIAEIMLLLPKAGQENGELYSLIFSRYTALFEKTPRSGRRELSSSFASFVFSQNSMSCSDSFYKIVQRCGVIRSKSCRRFYFFSSVLIPMLSKTKRVKAKLEPVRHFAAAVIKYKVPPKYYFDLHFGKLSEDIILFAGFDFRYTGNSRYLFEELIRRDCAGKKIYFACPPGDIDPQYRVKPDSTQFYKLAARARIIVFESWTTPRIIKRDGSVWVQLWHGTPIKKLMFDSAEYDITSSEPLNKVRKYSEIKRWDWLLSDCPAATKLFETCMLFDEKKIITAGYPRVKYLIDNIGDKALAQSIRERIGVGNDKKVVLYLPTWRDYNRDLPQDEQDNSFYLDIDRLLGYLPECFAVVYKTHFFKQSNADFSNGSRVYDGGDIETQQLLLTADYVLTDYSSAVFDALAVDIPVIMLCKDFEKYEKSRGVYPEVWRSFEPFVCTDEREAASLLLGYSMDGQYRELKEKYSRHPLVQDLPSVLLSSI